MIDCDCGHTVEDSSQVITLYTPENVKEAVICMQCYQEDFPDPRNLDISNWDLKSPEVPEDLYVGDNLADKINEILDYLRKKG